MAAGKRWNREELLVVLNLYHKLRFGQFDKRQRVVIDLAVRIKRTPDAVAMKLSNLASLDPVLKLRGIKGLAGASQFDAAMWEEFHTAPAELIPLSQELFDALFVESEKETTEVIPGKGIRRIKRPLAGETEVTRVTKQRRGQDYFRDMVLNNYGNACAITGLPIRELLVASHILPWSSHETERLNVRNGICLNRLHDSAFDQHLIGFDQNLCLVLSKNLKSALPKESVAYHFEAYEGRVLNLPEDGTSPEEKFLSLHRKKLER